MLIGKPERVDIPHEPGEWFEIVPLSWKKLELARDKMSKQNLDTMKNIGAELMKALRSDDEAAVRSALKRQRYEESQFDTATILEHGVLDWSYEGNVTEEALEQLDERTMAWCKQVIIDVTRPPDEDEEKNSSGGSTDT